MRRLTTPARSGWPRSTPTARRLGLAVLLTVAFLASILAAPAAQAQEASAAVPSAAESAALAPDDPFERMNRWFYYGHDDFDRVLFRPAALGYAKIAPSPVRKGLRNFVQNMTEPVVFANDVLQLKFKRAVKTAARILMNTTAGIGGLFDPATAAGIEHHDNGFGDTLGHYGVKPGPYLFLPLIGPSDLRDALGSVVDLASDPVSHIHIPHGGQLQGGLAVVHGLDERAEADPDLQRIGEMGSDSYATLRSLYLQNRQAEIGGGEVDINALPSFDDTPAPAASPTPEPEPDASSTPSLTPEPTPAAPATETAPAEGPSAAPGS